MQAIYVSDITLGAVDHYARTKRPLCSVAFPSLTLGKRSATKVAGYAVVALIGLITLALITCSYN